MCRISHSLDPTVDDQVIRLLDYRLKKLGKKSRSHLRLFLREEMSDFGESLMTRRVRSLEELA